MRTNSKSFVKFPLYFSPCYDQYVNTNSIEQLQWQYTGSYVQWNDRQSLHSTVKFIVVIFISLGRDDTQWYVVLDGSAWHVLKYVNLKINWQEWFLFHEWRIAILTVGMLDKQSSAASCMHDDVIKWKDFPRYWPFVRGIHRFPVNSPHKGQWRGALMFSSICVWINRWVNNPEAGNLRRYRAHYDVTVMVRGFVVNFVGFMRYKLEYRAHNSWDALYMEWYMIWYMTIWCDIWNDMTWYDIWYDISHDVIYSMSCDMIRFIYDTICYNILFVNQ